MEVTSSDRSLALGCPERLVVEAAQPEGGGRFRKFERSHQSPNLQKQGLNRDHLWPVPPADAMRFIRKRSLEKGPEDRFQGSLSGSRGWDCPQPVKRVTALVMGKATIGPGSFPQRVCRRQRDAGTRDPGELSPSPTLPLGMTLAHDL